MKFFLVMRLNVDHIFCIQLFLWPNDNQLLNIGKVLEEFKEIKKKNY